MTEEDLITAGKLHYNSKNYEQSLDCYSRALSKNPNIATYFGVRAQVLFCLNRFVESAADGSRALELDPKHVQAHYILGLALCRLKRFEEGLSHMTRAINFDTVKNMINRKRIKRALFRNRKLRREAIKQEKAKKLKKAEKEAKKAREREKWINVRKAQVENAKKLKKLRYILNQIVAKKRQQQLEKMKTAVRLQLDDRERLKIEKLFYTRMLELNAIFAKLEKKYKGVYLASTIGAALKLE